MGWTGRLAIAAFCVALAVPTISQAQKPNEKAKNKARKMLKSGDQVLRRGDNFTKRGKDEKAQLAYNEALEIYQAAFDLYPQPKIYFPIARAEEKLGRWMDSFRHYTQLLEEAEGLNDRVKEAVRARLNAVKKHLAAFEFVIVPDGATVTVDENEIGTSPLTEPFWVAPGEHSFKVSADGYLPQEGTAQLDAGDVDDEKISLEKIPAVRKIKRADPLTDPGPEKPQASRLPLWIGLGMTTTLAAAATITGIVAVKRHGTFSDDLEDADDREDARSSGRKLAFTTDALVLATLASGAFTAYYYYGIYRPKQERLEQEAASGQSAENALWFTPYADPNGGGLAIGGRF